jgi:hypothetical protein
MIQTCDRVVYILRLRQYWVLLVIPDDPSGGTRSVTGVVRGLVAGVEWVEDGSWIWADREACDVFVENL